MSNSDSGQHELLDQLAREFAVRSQRGERPALEEYTDRYPELADEIRELFPVMAKVEQAEGVPRDGDATVDAGWRSDRSTGSSVRSHLGLRDW